MSGAEMMMEVTALLELRASALEHGDEVEAQRVTRALGGADAIKYLASLLHPHEAQNESGSTK
jgi:hypothetical protein